MRLRNADLPAALLYKMEGERPSNGYVGNGCTCAPDTIGGIDIRPACHYHETEH